MWIGELYKLVILTLVDSFFWWCKNLQSSSIPSTALPVKIENMQKLEPDSLEFTLGEKIVWIAYISVLLGLAGLLVYCFTG